ncbi:MAG: hypothetical protein RRB13_02645 [bacterium]|nr:hypothetical protein [bacterium]
MKTLILLLCSLGLASATLAAKKPDPPTCPKALDPAKVKKYQIIKQERSSSTRIDANIYAPHAKTIEERAQTAMQAALEIQKETQARYVWVIMIRSPEQPESPWRANASFNPEAHRDKHVVWRVVTQVASRPRYNAQFTTYCQQWEPSKLTPLKSTQVDHIKPPPPEIHHTSGLGLCTVSKENLMKANKLFDAHKEGELMRMVEEYSLATLKEDLPVYLEDETNESFIAIRPKNESVYFWCFTSPSPLKD